MSGNDKKKKNLFFLKDIYFFLLLFLAEMAHDSKTKRSASLFKVTAIALQWQTAPEQQPTNITEWKIKERNILIRVIH